MSETRAQEAPHWNTGALWGILAALLVIGTLGGALFVFALTVWVLAGGLFIGFVLAAVGALVAFLAFLFMAGILYRIDRYRGANHRVVKFFE